MVLYIYITPIGKKKKKETSEGNSKEGSGYYIYEVEWNKETWEIIIRHNMTESEKK